MNGKTGGMREKKIALISRLFRKRPSEAQESVVPPAVPLGPHERIYAIGDIHGRSDLLDAMRALILRDLHDNPVPKAHIVYLGDYVDRGHDSAGVIERLAVPPPDLPPATALIGNHDLVFRDFLKGQDVGGLWRDMGGFETMRSYNVAPQSRPGRRWLDAAREELVALMPEHHVAWLEGLALSLDRPPYFFCHAGVQPGVPIEKQDASTLMWIRDAFLRSDADFGRIVVHGHTPAAAPEIRHNRIGVDTRAFKSGILSCAVLEVGAIRILQTHP